MESEAIQLRTATRHTVWGKGGTVVQQRLAELPAKIRARLPRHVREGRVFPWTLNIHIATPHWLSVTDKARMRRSYRQAAAQGKVVDHIVPLQSPLVCGLHVPWNLQRLTLEENARKSNRWWPDMPDVQLELFSERQEELNLG